MSYGKTLDRRESIVSAAALAAATYVPGAFAAPPAVGNEAPKATLADWHIDDMWGVYPRPSEAIGYGRPHRDGELFAAVHPADWQYVA